MSRSSSTSPSELFKLVEAGDRVWAAVATDWEETVGNAAVVDLGGRVLVVDTFLTARPAAELRRAALKLTGAEAAWVVNTHFHTDHCGGNEIFASAARIAATEGTRDRILEREAALPARIAAAEARLAELGGGGGGAGGKGGTADPEVERQRGELAHEIEVLRRMRVVAPEATFTDRLTIRGERRRVEVLAVGAAHTLGDAVVHLPEERTLIAGDVVVNEVHPWVGDGDIRSWIEVLGRLSGMAAETVVPGHGEVGQASTVADMADYMRDLLGLVEAAVAAAPGVAPEDLPVPEIPERWRSLYMHHTWPGDFPAAVRAAARRV
jgi:cyclase